MSLSSISVHLRQAVAERDNGRCGYCGLFQFGQGALFHVDHVIPRSRGGLTALDNLALQCPYCSLHKSNKILAFDSVLGVERPLFHPLQQIWREHFRQLENGECEGCSSVARATIAALRINDPIPRMARAIQIANGILKVR